jgi:hypothetical protein
MAADLELAGPLPVVPRSLEGHCLAIPVAKAPGVFGEIRVLAPSRPTSLSPS